MACCLGQLGLERLAREREQCAQITQALALHPQQMLAAEALKQSRQGTHGIVGTSSVGTACAATQPMIDRRADFESPKHVERPLWSTKTENPCPTQALLTSAMCSTCVSAVGPPKSAVSRVSSTSDD